MTRCFHQKAQSFDQEMSTIMQKMSASAAHAAHGFFQVWNTSGHIIYFLKPNDLYTNTDIPFKYWKYIVMYLQP